ncbi:MAG: hypothetical protein ACD_16C00074G0009 [uncultured bacterium]|nr:MAG: hypothetical protein ACD_16C00074G0009 [uncultured bacterium]OFW68676.1 MAG: hypothetical protein A2X70_04330 [Alphaproteobacteria bacterium GWC2_42_16]OFW73313.1 MAG: hypothetical protein A2Z80_07420 [Alphaproteobacteria bacterium GWA2_41_27]OFW81778.1 MAG: hypothetical protein A3E50_02685 [Alphaproteobacteria bacterium RIFCSPHIGHO2_12_FULL_42_100]OFW85703.1 MAG: hypothetical protein A2W06_06545 [Alphaproteobacteria bacterium RBG_16_42_14]OFW92426.1 MAG: hypothetical protein A2W46_045
MSLFPKTYSRYVNFIKLTLLIGIVLAFGFTFGWPYIMSLGKEDMVLVDASRPEIQENRMVHPHYVSTDETDQPFHVDADWAKQTTEGIADLTNPSGAITVEEGQTFNLEAKEGYYDNQGKFLDLKGDVTLTSTDGYHVHTQKARITLENKVIEGDLSIEGEGPAGKIYGQNGFKIENRSEGKKVITLKGPSRIEINRGSLKKKKG